MSVPGLPARVTLSINIFSVADVHDPNGGFIILEGYPVTSRRPKVSLPLYISFNIRPAVIPEPVTGGPLSWILG